MTTDHRAKAEWLLSDADEWAAQAGELSPEASERACLAYAQVHALLAIHDALTAADRYATNEAKQREAGADPLDEDDHRDWVAAANYAANEAHVRHLLGFDRRQDPLAFAPEADGAPSVAAPAADDPADDAVDGEDGERRYLNAQTVREMLAIVGRWAGKCLHEWAEDTCVGDTARHFICTECGTTRTEDRQ